jgi:hypothetical protein
VANDTTASDKTAITRTSNFGMDFFMLPPFWERFMAFSGYLP